LQCKVSTDRLLAANMLSHQPPSPVRTKFPVTIRSAVTLLITADIRRSSRLIYLWLYLLVGVNELTAWWSNYPTEAAANKLGGFLIAGVVVLVLIRIPAAVRPIRRLSVSMRTATTSRAEG
jgi:hypothetical protein